LGKKANEQDKMREDAEAQLARLPLTLVQPQPGEELLHELLHELKVHQIQLEMQNEELRVAQIALEESRDRYVDLYEFAPVGYLSLNHDGMIEEINLTGATLLGVARNKLPHHRFAPFVATEDRDRWHRHFLNVLTRDNTLTCELTLQHGDESIFYARLDCLCLKKVGKEPVIRIVLTDITERKSIERKLRELTAHLQTVREQEKANIAREIHDELGGTMTAMKIKIHQLRADLPENSSSATLLEQVDSMSQLIDSASGITRRIIADLHPTILDYLGLLAAIEWQAAQFHKLTGIEYLVNCIGDKGNLDKPHSIALFRILQEALTNVTKHSSASKVEIEYHHGDEEVMLSICDNGRGLSEVQVAKSGGYGILGIKERVEQLGGTVKFDIPPSGGFCLMVIVPLPSGERSI
jgi:PAS domain S-box-containing protein